MKQKLLAFFALALMATLPASADYQIDGLNFSVRNNEATVTSQVNGSQNPGGDLVIPDSISVYGRTYPVTTIGIQAFYDDKITSVDIPRTITKMDFGAFVGCYSLERVNIHDWEAWCKMTFVNNWANPLFYANRLFLDGEELTEVVIPGSITALNNFVFVGWQALKSVVIPNTVTSIGTEAFCYCYNLENIEIPAGVDTIGSAAFGHCKSLTSLILPPKIRTIGMGTFGSCEKLTEMVIPDSVTYIGNGAFTYCYSLESVYIPDGVTYIGERAFEYCPLTSIEFPNSLTTIADGAFGFCNSLTSIHIPASVLSIGKRAFGFSGAIEHISVDSDNPIYDSRGNCEALIETNSNTLLYGTVNTIIPNTVTSINELAFYRRKGLTSIEIPNSVVSIGYCAFTYCPDLAQINIPNSVTTIGREAFDYCTELSCGIDIPNSVTLIGESAFRGCRKMPYVTIGSGVDSIGKEAFSYCYYLEHITVNGDNPKYDSRGNCDALIETSTNTLLYGAGNTVVPNTVTTIAPRSFSYMKSLTSIDIPNSVTHIGEMAFLSSSLRDLTIRDGDNDVTIDKQAFEYCGELLAVHLPNSVTSVGQSAFHACNKLEEFTIGSGLKVISDKMVNNCVKLNRLIIGSAVDTIGTEAFYNCYRLTDITCLAITPPRAAPDIFTYYHANPSIYNATLSVPLAAVEAYQAASPWSEFTNIVGILIGGDINGDGELTVSDLSVLINLILSDGELPASADVNGDGVANMTDVTLLINGMLNAE